MNVELIAVGTEILLGDIANTDAQMISQNLANIGLNVFYHTVVGDNPKRLEEVLELAKKRADIIITTGGLGPTYDDLTKEIICKSFGKELVMDEVALDDIVKHFVRVGKTMTENNKKQALVPKDSVIFYNKWGTAPGCAFGTEDNHHVLMLPGPPRECEAMLKYWGLPYLQQFSDGIIHSVNLKIFGRGESEMEDMLKDKMVSLTNPTLAPYAKQGECLVRITAKADTLEKAIEMIAPVKKDVYDILGDAIYGEDANSLEEVLMAKLIEKDIKVAVAESCTGGMLSKRMTDIAGISDVFLGSVCSYANSIKINVLGVKPETLESFGAVSRETAREMAKGVADLFKADLAASITGVAGPTGGTEEKPVGLVHICIYYKGEYYDFISRSAGNRDAVRHKASSVALDEMRKIILG